MNKLGTMKACPKCGCIDFTIVYIEPLLQERFSAEPLVLQDEYIEIECTRCGYIEKELPLDAEVKDERNT